MEQNLVRRVSLNEREYRFDLCRKRNQSMGPVTVDHWWMPVTLLYAQRQGNTPPAPNHTEIVRLYWAVVEQQQATAVRSAQERLLLAALVPKVRVEGSRTIFADAFLRRSPRSQQSEAIATLDALLLAEGETRLTRAEFHEGSWNALGRPEFPPGLQERYETLSRELLDEPCRILGAGDFNDAIFQITEIWDRFHRSIGRRGGHREERIVLDVISYEARAAFHHCYSVAWSALIPLLASGENIGSASTTFLRFWHTDWIDSQTYASLFHGHVFGLHPGTGLFTLTETGPRLLGEWLAAPNSVEAFGRLLRGLLIALFDYSGHRGDVAANRRNPAEQAVSDLTITEEIQEERRRGRRRP